MLDQLQVLIVLQKVIVKHFHLRLCIVIHLKNSFYSIVKKPRLTSAEKMRMYRQRLRVKQMIQNSSILEIQLHSCENNTLEELNNRQNTNSDTFIMSEYLKCMYLSLT